MESPIERNPEKPAQTKLQMTSKYITDEEDEEKDVDEITYAWFKYYRQVMFF